jgi:glycosyltransferase involved in cell wall biosynthesis
MKFLIIIPTLGKSVGGMERFVIELSLGLYKLGHVVTIFTGKSNNDIELSGVKIIRHKLWVPRLFNKPIKYYHLSYLAKQHLKKNSYDFVLAMGHSGIFLKEFIWRASGSPIPIIREYKKSVKLSIVSRFVLFFDLMLQQYIEKRCILKAKYHMFPSLELKKEFEKDYSFESKRYFIPCSGSLTINNSKNAFSSKEFKILTVRGLTEERKGAKIIIDTLSKLKGQNIKLVVVGKINIKIPEDLKQYIIAKGEIPYNEMEQIYKNCDALIFPSFLEGFPNTILEAASYGLPIISTKISGIEEYFNQKEIILVKKNTPLALKKAILSLANSQKKRKLLSINIKKRNKDIGYDLLIKEFMQFIISGEHKNLLYRNV